MKPVRPAWVAAFAVAAWAFCPAMGQGESWLEATLPSAAPAPPSPLQPAGYHAPEHVAPAWQLEPSAESDPAWLLALWGVAPYAELQAAGLPLPPAPADVAALPVSSRVHQQSALKAVWLEYLIRSREERYRVSSANAAQASLQALKQGAPAGFADVLQRLAVGGLSPREHYRLESALECYLLAYGVDSRELRFFVEGCGLSPAELRDAVAWLPLPALFNRSALAASLTPQRLAADYAAELVVRSELAAAWRSVVDAASADAAASALLPVLACHMSALPSLLHASPDMGAAVVAPYARYAGPVNAAWSKERSRLQEHDFFGSARLRVLDYLFH